jgi:hypothetical protein
MRPRPERVLIAFQCLGRGPAGFVSFDVLIVQSMRGAKSFWMAASQRQIVSRDCP